MSKKEFSPQSIHQANVEKGFYDVEHSITKKLQEYSSYDTVDNIFTSEEVEFIQRAFQAQRLMLMVSELGEAMEALRHNDTVANRTLLAYLDDHNLRPVGDLDPNSPDDVAYYKKHYKDTVEDEKADNVIRAYDDAGRTNMDMDGHIRMKLAVNATREYRHGKHC